MGMSDDGWPASFPLSPAGKVPEGIPVFSRTEGIEGRTTGSRRRCASVGCPGWFIGVRWETGQMMHICSEGWTYDDVKGTVRVTGGGEISARFVSPAPLGTPPLPREQWPGPVGAHRARLEIAREPPEWRRAGLGPLTPSAAPRRRA